MNRNIYAVLTLALILSVAPACGGEDGKTKDSTGGSGAKARAFNVGEEWIRKHCEVFQACQKATFDSFNSSLDRCIEIDLLLFENDTKPGGALGKKPESCYAKFASDYESCKNVVVSKSAGELCPYFGKTAFSDASPPNTIYDAFPECGATLAALKQAYAECSIEPVAFVGAPTRRSGVRTP